MKISGFTFCRNVHKFDYPVVESIRSILPFVDEYVVNVGDSEDGTLDTVRSIRDPKVRIIESVWDEGLTRGGAIYAQQTNIALAACTGDWAFYLQADEVVHENDLPVIHDTLRRLDRDARVLGLMFRYLHFEGDYHTVDPWKYRKSIRIVRNNGEVISWGDACGFARRSDSLFLQSAPRGIWRHSGAWIFHYGWVKHPRTMIEKTRYHVSRYHGDAPPETERVVLAQPEYRFEKYDILKEFRGTHPAVMAERVRMHPRLRPRRNRWLNPRFYAEVLRHGFKG